jgi:hypothetical protein
MVMTALRRIWVWALAGVLAGAVPARADVTAQTTLGFVSRNVVVVSGTPAAVWKRLLTPSAWWSSDHTFSGSAANMTLDPVAGGCFCEKLPSEDAAPVKPGTVLRPRGGVEHMRVVYVDHAKALRMIGALGPLQSEAVSATLTVTLKTVDGGTRVIFEYVVGGYMRYPADKIAPAVDTVLANQLASLAKAFGPVEASTASAGPPAEDAPAPVRHGLDRNGVLLPRGRVWSLPSGEPAPRPMPADPLPTIAPLAAAPVPQDDAPQGGTAPAKKRAGRKKVEAAPQPVVAPDTPPVAPQASLPAAAPVVPVETAPPPAKPAVKAAAKKPAAKPVKKPAVASDEPTRDSIDSAFDAAFGGAPRPPAQ